MVAAHLVERAVELAGQLLGAGPHGIGAFTLGGQVGPCGLEVHACLDEQPPQLLVLRLVLCELFLEAFEIAGRRGQRFELLRQAVDQRPDLGVHPEGRRQECLDRQRGGVEGLPHRRELGGDRLAAGISCMADDGRDVGLGLAAKRLHRIRAARTVRPTTASCTPDRR